MKFGYIRVSTVEQNLARQEAALKAEGIHPANIYADKMSGACKSRPALDELLTKVQPGDSITVMSFDRLARSTSHLLQLSEQLDAMGVDLISLKEKVDTSTPQGRLFFTLTAAIAQFEREIIRERQAEGIALAKEQGRMMGRPRTDNNALDAAIALYKDGSLSVAKISAQTGVSRSVLYREIKARGISR